MAVFLAEQHPEIEFERVCTPTGDEPPEWYEHMRKLRDRLGPIKPIARAGYAAYVVKRLARKV